MSVQTIVQPLRYRGIVDPIEGNLLRWLENLVRSLNQVPHDNYHGTLVAIQIVASFREDEDSEGWDIVQAELRAA